MVLTTEKRNMGAESARLHHLRLYEPFPVMVRGVDANGESFEVNTVLDNISAGGLYVRLGRRVELGTRLFAIARLSVTPSEAGPGPRVAIRGVVVRAEPLPDSTWGVALKFTHHRFL